jgi:maltose-binding protein MalE
MSKSPLRILMMLLTFALAACATSGKDESSSPAANKVTATPVATRPLVIWTDYSGVEIDTLNQIALDFKATQPLIDVQIEAVDASALLEQFKTAITQGAGPDLLIGPDTWLMPLANHGYLQPFGQDMIDLVSSNLTKTIAYATLLDGTPYAVAFTADFATLYYNRAIVETPAADYSELVAQGVLYKVLIVPDFLVTSGFYLSRSNRLLDEQGQSLMTQPGLETYFADLRTLAGSTGITFTADPTDFVERRAGLLLGSSADYRTLKTALGDDLGVTRLPTFEYGFWRALLRVEPVMLSLNTTIETVESARQFIVFLTTSGTQRDWFEQTGITPVNPAQLAEDDLRDAWVNTMEWGVGAPLSDTFFGTLLPALDQAVQAVTLEGQDPAAAAAEIMSLVP